jgi:hypothetical protein
MGEVGKDKLLQLAIQNKKCGACKGLRVRWYGIFFDVLIRFTGVIVYSVAQSHLIKF